MKEMRKTWMELAKIGEEKNVNKIWDSSQTWV